MSKTTSGNKIYIDDALRAPLINFELEGKTTQETRSGINKLKMLEMASTTTNGLTYKVENEVFYINGTHTAGANLSTIEFEDFTLPAGTYYFYLLRKGTSRVDISMRGVNGVVVSATNFGNVFQNTLTNRQFTLSEETTFTRFAFYVPNGITFNNDEFRIMVCNASHTASEYEKYGAMPSPDYPSELVSVGYKNLFDVNATPITTINTSTNSIEKGKRVAINYGSTYQFALFKLLDVSNYVGKTFSVKIDFQTSANNKGQYNIGLCDENGGNRISGRSTPNSGALLSYTIPTITTSKYLAIWLYANTNGTANVDDYVDYTNIEVELGEDTHNYISYGKYGIEVITTGKNLLLNNGVNSTTINGVTFTKNQDGSVTINGTATANANFPIFGNGWSNTSSIIRLENGTNYTLSKGTANAIVYIRDGINNINTETPLNGARTFNNISNITYAFIQVANGRTASNEKIYPMIEKGSTATTYQEHKENTYSYVLDEPLRGIGNYKDLLYIKNGMLYVERKIGKVVLNGSENWGGNKSQGYYTQDNNMARLNDYTNAIKSNYFLPTINHTFNYNASASNDLKITGYNKSTSYEGQNWIYINYYQMANASALKTWLSTHNTEVYYARTTPIIEDIGEAEAPIVNHGINDIYLLENLGTTMSITYTNDFSSADKIALRANTAAIKCKLTVLADGNLPAIELTEENSVKDWEYTDERLVPGQGFVGQFIGRTLDGNLQNISDDFDILNREINLSLGIYRINDDVTTWYDFGNFIVTEPEDNEVNDNTKFETMDYTKLFNKPFNGDYTDETFTTSYNDLMGVNLTDAERTTFVVTPITARWLALYTCAQAGVTLATTDFTNNDFEIDINPFQAGETCRDVMKEIGKLALSWVRIGWDNRCYIDFSVQDLDVVDGYDILDNNQYFSLETTEETTPIDGVGFGMKDVDGETAFKIKNDAPIDSAENILYVYDNPLLYTFDKRYQAVQQANTIFGLTYMQLKTETIGHPWLTGTELINVKNMENNDNHTYAFNKTIKYTGHIRSIINSIDETEVEKTLGYTSSTVQATRRASINVNKQEGTIELLTSRVSVVEDGLGDTYTKEETNNLIEDVAGLTNQYITSGGANKFRNTGLWYKTDDGNGFEYWNGTVVVADDDNSASSTVMMLQNSTLTQTLSNVPNGDYTISFKYEKLNPTSTLQILINSTDYSELLSTSGTFEKTITVSTNSIEISFVCNTNNSWKVYELMCNVGATPLVWTQHPNEVRTDTVNISKGITITSTTTNAVFKANADGIRIENQAERTTTNFLEDGMETDNATIRKQARVSGALHTIVGNQTWISGIL